MSFFHFSPKPSRIAPHIKNGDNASNVVDDLVIDREREAAGEHSVVAQSFAMDAGVEKERVDVGKNAIKEVTTDPLLLSFIKGHALAQIAGGLFEKDDVSYTPHEKRLRSSSRLRNFASPDAIFARRALTTV